MPTFNLALQAWQSADEFRRRRDRYKRYTYGRQWDDPVRTRSGSVVSESDAVAAEGQQPLTNNMIRQLVKCVIGNFRSSLADSDPASAAAPDRATATRNSLLEMDCRLLEEFLISGCAIQRVVAEKRPAGEGVWVDNVSPDDFFVNRFSDPRGLDIELAGQLHSMSLREVMMRWGNRYADSPARINRAYRNPHGCGDGGSRFSRSEPGRCRVIEVWTLESRQLLRCHDRAEGRFFVCDSRHGKRIGEINASRYTAENRIDTAAVTSVRWRCRIYAPDGTMLDEYDSPFAHGRHPYAIKFYPLTDGEVHSLVEDIIEQQRHINRLITLIDQILRVSAKGVLLYPVEQKPEFLSWHEIGDMWARTGSVMPYDPKSSQLRPQQIVTAGESSGAYSLLDTQLRLFQQISGVSDALQGRTPATLTSAALYDSQLRSAAVALLDLLDTFNNFRLHRNLMMKEVTEQVSV